MEWIQHIYQWIISLDADQVNQIFQHYANLGPLPGILLPFIEALFSPIPLFAVVAANVIAYGFLPGFLYSCLGSMGGAIVVFLIARKFGNRFRHYVQKKYPRSQGFFTWVQRKGFTPLFILFILYSLPFTPSFLMNISCGISDLPLRRFALPMVLGKTVMILGMSYVGHDWYSFILHPWRIVVGIVFLAILWLIGKRMEKNYQLG